MKNKEYYIDEIAKIFANKETGCAFRLAHIPELSREKCGALPCTQCDKITLKWLEEEYIEPEPEINWEEVPYNTKVYVRDNEYSDWKLRTFVCYNPKYFEPFVCVANMGKSAVGWKYAKLVDERDIMRFKKKVN